MMATNAPAISNCVSGLALETKNHILEISKTNAHNFRVAFLMVMRFN
jgi:hypothetical protein